MIRSGLTLACALGIWVVGFADEANPCRACDRELRKTIESLQAWRRSHDGHYPGRVVELKESGLLPLDRAVCPDWWEERPGADAAHKQVTSRLERGDPPGTYEYELSDCVLKSLSESIYLAADAPLYTRQDVKVELLRRPFSHQVPLLRCSSHRLAAPSPFAGQEDVRRNATAEGKIYWSDTYWEQLWLEDVPYCARDANVLFGLKGPPFHTERAPAIPGALDLRKWNCAFGDRAWWWTYPYFDTHSNRQLAAHLGSFFNEEHGRVMEVAATKWWIDGLVQLQGRVGSEFYREPGMLAFVWERTGLPIGKSIRRASWLQGTVWSAVSGDIAGWLIWHYQDSTSERVPITYGRTTARFWGDGQQIEGEKDFPESVWNYHETAEAVGKERWLRLYQQTWINPRPAVPVTALDFVSNSNCPAAPFLIALNVFP
ncbi:MAG TPA: hypothetical protein VGF13_08775 [Verrucomicrobiae bacterium]|jgi:hypothetical protein